MKRRADVLSTRYEDPSTNVVNPSASQTVQDEIEAALVLAVDDLDCLADSDVPVLDLEPSFHAVDRVPDPGLPSPFRGHLHDDDDAAGEQFLSCKKPDTPV